MAAAGKMLLLYYDKSVIIPDQKKQCQFTDPRVTVLMC